jgi:amino acid adenylation domain-containing protein
LTFDAAGEGQTVQPPPPVQVPLLDLSDLPAPERRERVAAVLREEVETPFDLVSGPIARVRLLKEGADRHLLVLTAHHIACDGLSARVLFQELATAYGAAREGTSPELPPAVPFSRVIAEESQEEGRERSAAALAYWQSIFAADVPVLDLPADRSRPPMKTYLGGREVRTVSEELGAGIRHTATAHGVTLVSFLLAAFEVLLYRLSGRADVVVGLPTSTRTEPDEALVGHTTNLLPIRAQIDPGASFGAHLDRVAKSLLDALDHRHLTFGTLVRELNLPRDPSRTPLVAATFNVDRGRGAPRMADLETELTLLPRAHLNFELEMNVADLGSGFRLECTYNRDLYSADTVLRWLGHFEMLLRGAVASPQTPTAELALLTDADREQIAAWNATEAAVPGGCVHDLISTQAGRTPDRVALEFKGTTLTYRQLQERSDRLARRLRAAGVRPGVRVGVFLERSLEMVVGLLGVLKAGGTYVPLDPAFPPERLSYMVQDSEAALLLTHAEVEADVPTREVPVLRVDEEPPDPEGDVQGPAASVDDLAYVIYTSGSTGKPKGVAITHRNLVNLLASMGREPGLGETDSLLSVTTLSFDIAALELFLPLITGARVVVASREEALDGHLLLDRLRSSAATVMQATPATWRLLIDSGWQSVPGLRILCGGEALPRDLADELRERASEVWNVYGPTETTVWSSVWRVEPGEGPVSIGRPIANTRFYVLDEQSNQQPVGVPGEIFIGGTGVAPGYWKRPELTEERFVRDPFSESPEARMYRTGDLGRWLPDGRLECLGRLDHQVKVRGFRIELGEIESALREQPEVSGAVVLAREDRPGDRRLVAYVIASEETEAGLRAALRARVPEYMVPSSFVFLSEFPLTPNGKVDRRALPAPESEGSGSAREYVAPRTDTEKTLSQIWAAVLGRDQVGVEDSFFDLGGSSLLLTRAAGRARDAGLELTVLTMFRFPTVKALSEHLDGGAETSRRYEGVRSRAERQRQAAARRKGAHSRPLARRGR